MYTYEYINTYHLYLMHRNSKASKLKAPAKVYFHKSLFGTSTGEQIIYFSYIFTYEYMNISEYKIYTSSNVFFFNLYLVRCLAEAKQKSATN